MNRNCFAVIISACFILLSFSAAAAQDSYDMTEYFPLQASNKWVYDTTMNYGDSPIEMKMSIAVFGKETFEGKEVYVLGAEEQNAQKYYYYYGKDGIYLTKIAQDGYNTVFQKPLLFVPNNFKIGQETAGFVSAEVVDQDNKSLDEVIIDYKLKLIGVEDIDVGAGEFSQCLKAESKFVYNSKTTILTTDATMWYAKGVGKVKEESRGSIQRENVISKTEMNLGLKYARIGDKEIGSLEDKKEEMPEEKAEVKTEN